MNSLSSAGQADPRSQTAARTYETGMMLAAQNRLEEAALAFRRAGEQLPDFAESFLRLGETLNRLGRPLEALPAFEKARALTPDSAAATYGTALAMQNLGRAKAARPLFEAALALAPDRPAIYRALAECTPFAAGDPLIARMETLLGAQTQTEGKILLHFALAKAHGDVARNDPDHTLDAFAHLQAGNALQRSRIVYDEAQALGAMAEMERSYTAAILAARGGLGSPSDLPVFVVGMPRSGTTLVEQILASHPRIFGAGEIETFARCTAETLPDANRLFAPQAFSREMLCAIGERYLQRIRPLAPDAARIVNKLTGNILYAGLIRLCLPGARIVHIRRDPMDTCFSCYTKLFTHQNGFAYDLGELGRYYRSYRRLSAHWRAVLPPDRYLEIDYEKLVADLPGQARRLIAFCGLDWDEACLAFHRTERNLMTASAAQVRQPIYRSAIGRWRPYAAFLQPLSSALAAA